MIPGKGGGSRQGAGAPGRLGVSDVGDRDRAPAGGAGVLPGGGAGGGGANGPDAAPLFRFLTENAPGLLGSKKIKWNFTKFLVDGAGNVVRRYAPTVKPADLHTDIEELLEG